MFKTKDKKRIDELNDEKQALKNELSDLKQQKKNEEEDIKHMAKIVEEGNEIKVEKKMLELDREQAAEIAKVKDEYQGKVEADLKDQIERMTKMYSEILDRLPNVGVKLKGEV
jgi:hypothetical protein